MRVLVDQQLRGLRDEGVVPTEADNEDILAQTVLVPSGSLMWQMPEVVHRCVSQVKVADVARGCDTEAEQSSQTLKGADRPEEDSAPLKRMAAVIPLDERRGWGSVDSFGCSWVEIVVSLLLAYASLRHVPKWPIFHFRLPDKE